VVKLSNPRRFWRSRRPPAVGEERRSASRL
jgi:hypothetical protein